MTEPSHSARFQTQPPPAPPLPPNRAGVFQRIIAPLSFNRAPRPQDAQTSHSTSVSPRNVSGSHLRPQLASQTVAHRTGLEISAVDINDQKTHAILAGKEILKTVKVQDGKAVEDVNVRSAVYSSATARQSRPDEVNSRRQFLPAKDVRWSHGHYSHVVATAAQNGRIALYDVSAIGSSRVELSWLYLHTGQVNKLDFDPHRGYMLLSGSQDKTCKIWDIRNPRAPSPYNQYNVRAPVRDVRWSPTDAYEFALCTESGVIQKWDVRYPSQAQLSINAHEKACYTIGWHPDGKHLVSGGLDKHLRVWDFKSENRRQKPMFQLRTPQGIMNLAWRPPCWSTEFGEASQWQSTQIATGYTDDDPRVHVWDFRRPLLPFREIDRYDSRPTDMLWASDNLLWCVGFGGMFSQTDVSHAPQVQEGLTPCATDWFPDGSFAAFAEERSSDRESSLADHTSNFLNVPPDKLSGEDGLASRSLTDDEETELMIGKWSRRPSKGASTRSAKSQGSSPPKGEGLGQVLPLDKAVTAKGDAFRNRQVGTVCSIEGLGVEPGVLTFMADKFPRPLTEAERKADPERILAHLEESFVRNADVCDTVSMHRTAQSWRILSAVIIPELTQWAEKNKKARLANEAKQKERDLAKRSSLRSNTPSPFAKVSSKIADARSPHRSEKMMSSLFRTVVNPEKTVNDLGSTSNMTTPLAKPLPDSPTVGTNKKDGSTWFTLNDSIEPIPPLPPSVISSHSTAQAASSALLDDEDESTSSSASSLYRPRQQSNENKSNNHNANDASLRSPSDQQRSETSVTQIDKNRSAAAMQTLSPIPHRFQEERRAALKDYRPQARQVFTLEEPAPAPKYKAASRHDSGDSFLMFSASTDSSRKATSWEHSLETGNAASRARLDSEDLSKQHRHDYTPPSEKLGPVDSSRGNGNSRPEISFISETTDFADDSPELAFSMEGTYDSLHSLFQNAQNAPNKNEAKPHSRPESKQGQSSTIWEPLGEKSISSKTHAQAEKVKADIEQLQSEEAVAPAGQGLKIFNSNPIRSEVLISDGQTRTHQAEPALEESILAKSDSDPDKYLYEDFRPIDFARYEPELPFAWSALPLICQIIEFDLNEGIATGFFSTQLLMHIHPYFFHQSFRATLRDDLPIPSTLSERLMRPDLNARIIESLFARQLNYLKRLRMYTLMAELKKLCMEFDYPNIAGAGSTSEAVGEALTKDPMLLNMSCSHCYHPMTLGESLCRNCKRNTQPCPVCEAVQPSTNATIFYGKPSTGNRGNGTDFQPGQGVLWTFCHKCGHSGHLDCMSEWFALDDAEGQCPMRDCGCDCGPGLIREQRIARQRKAAEDSEAIRSSQSSVNLPKRDPHRASQSPAVDKARNSLRSSAVSLASDRGGTQSGDESTTAARRRSSLAAARNPMSVSSRASGFGGRSTGSGGPRSSFNKDASYGSRPRVRVVTPGEENPSQ